MPPKKEPHRSPQVALAMSNPSLCAVGAANQLPVLSTLEKGLYDSCVRVCVGAVHKKRIWIPTIPSGRFCSSSRCGGILEGGVAWVTQAGLTSEPFLKVTHYSTYRIETKKS